MMAFLRNRECAALLDVASIFLTKFGSPEVWSTFFPEIEEQQ
jgi:hypothetical protein